MKLQLSPLPEPLLSLLPLLPPLLLLLLQLEYSLALLSMTLQLLLLRQPHEASNTVVEDAPASMCSVLAFVLAVNVSVGIDVSNTVSNAWMTAVATIDSAVVAGMVMPVRVVRTRGAVAAGVTADVIPAT